MREAGEDEDVRATNLCLACAVTWLCCPLIGVYAVYAAGEPCNCVTERVID